MTSLVYFTICSKNYLGYAITLGRSLKIVEPNADFYIGLADEIGVSQPSVEIEFPIIEAKEIGLPTFEDMIVRYSIMEFNTAIKAKFFSHFFDALGFDQVVYLDPDIKILSKFEELYALLSEEPSAVLTPHSEAPLDDGKDPDDARLLRTGAYNLGFAAFSNRPDSRRFLEWWGRRMEVDCRVALAEGLFVDQKLMDLAPCYMDDVRILRHPGYNAAYWNLVHRPVTQHKDQWLAAGQPLRFFHFSGVIPGNTAVFSRHQDRFLPKDIGQLEPLFQSYVKEVEINNRSWRSASYAYEQIDGLKLDWFLRKVYARVFPYATLSASADAKALERLANAPVGESTGAQLTRYAVEVWSSRDDLKATFDISTATGRAGFANWICTSGRDEHKIDQRFLRAIKFDRTEVNPISLTEHSQAWRTPQNSPTQPLLRRPRYASALYRAALPFRPLYRILPPIIRNQILHLLFRKRVHPTQSGHSQAPAVHAELCIYGYFETESGVGEGARRAFRAMKAVGLDVEARTLQPDDRFLNTVTFDSALPDGPSLSPIRVYHINADQTAPGRNWLVKKPSDNIQIGYWAWELAQFPDAWIEAAEHLDEIWVPSKFVKAAVEAKINKPVVCIPHPVEVPDQPSETLLATARKRWNVSNEAFIILSTLDFNSYISRKNPLASIEAFKRAREGCKNLTMLLKVHGRGHSGATRRQVLDYAAKVPGIIVIDQVLNRKEIDELQWISNAFISLHRSEGFGLNIAESMAKAKPVIATDYSGSTDFVDETVGIPVPYTLVKLGPDDYPFADGQMWANPDIDAASLAIRDLYNNRDYCTKLGFSGRNLIKSKLSYTRVGHLIKDRLRIIRAE